MAFKTINYRTAKYALYFIIVAYFAVDGFTLIHSAQGTIWDAGLCIKMADNVYHHIPFNKYVHPNPRNLDADEYEFVTWWTPAQFLLPQLISKLFSVKLAAAIKIITAVCLLVAAIGIFKLFKQLLKTSDVSEERTHLLSLVFLIFTLAQSFFWFNLDEYDGGGILMLTYCPWFICWIIKLKKPYLYHLPLLFIAGFFGFFLKASFSSIFAGALFYLFLTNSVQPSKPLKQQDLKKIVKNGLYSCAVILVYLIVTKIAFLNYNNNIGNSSLGFKIQPKQFFFPFCAPLFGFLTLDKLIFTYQFMLSFIVVLPVYYLIAKSNQISLLYKYVLIGFVVTGIGFYTFLYFLNLDVSYQLRHYRILTILLTPAVFLIFKKWRVAQYIVYPLLAVYFAFNLYDYVVNGISVYKHKQVINTYSGLPFNYPPALISELHALDNLKDKGRDIFYFQSEEPAIALEIRNNRVLLEDNFITFHFKNQPRLAPILYNGKNSGELYVVYKLDNFKQDSTKFLTRFENYKQFNKIYQTNGYAIFRAIPSVE